MLTHRFVPNKENPSVNEKRILVNGIMAFCLSDGFSIEPVETLANRVFKEKMLSDRVDLKQACKVDTFSLAGCRVYYFK